MVEKWTWDAENTTKSVPTSEYALKGATAEETQKGYQALTEKGAVQNFSYKIWNDLCAKVQDVHDDWDTGYKFGEDYPYVWIDSPHLKDYPDETTYNATKQKGIMRADAMNQVKSAIPPSLNPSWKPVKKGDPCLAEYFLWIAEAINRWAELKPEITGILDEFLLEIQCCQTEAEALPILSNLMYFLHYGSVNAYVAKAQGISIGEDFSFEYKQVVHRTDSVPIFPYISDMELGIYCNVLDKNLVPFTPEIIDFILSIRYNIRELISHKIELKDDFIFDSKCNSRTSKIVPIVLPLDIFFNQKIEVGTSEPVSIRFKSDFKQDSKARVRNIKTLPFSVKDSYNSSFKVTIDYNGTDMLESSGNIQFLENFSLDSKPSSSISHDGEFGIEEEISLSDSEAKILQNNETIGISFEQELDVGISDRLIHDGNLSESSQHSLSTLAPDSLSHAGQFETIGNFELTFANEIWLITKADSFSIKDEAITIDTQEPNALGHDGKLRTSEKISYDTVPVIAIEGVGESSVETVAELDNASGKFASSDTFVLITENAEVTKNDIQGIESAIEPVGIETDVSLIAEQSKPVEIVEDVTQTFLEDSTISLSRKFYIDVDKEVTEVYETLADLITKAIRLIESQDNITVSEQGTEAILSLPTSIETETQILTSQTSLIDTMYVRGDSLVSETAVDILQESEVSIPNITDMDADIDIKSSSESVIDKAPRSEATTDEISQSDSSATIVMARIVLIPVSDYEEVLTDDMDEKLVDDIERKLIY